MDPQAVDDALLRLDLCVFVTRPFLNANAALESCARTGENSHKAVAGERNDISLEPANLSIYARQGFAYSLMRALIVIADHQTIAGNVQR